MRQISASQKTCAEIKIAETAARRIIIGLVLAGALFLLHNAKADPTAVNLGSDANFAVLAGSTVTSTGATVLNGDLGVSPGGSATGFPPGTVNGTTYLGDAVALQAQHDLTTAYNAAAGETPTQVLTGQNLGGLTLTPGVYFFASSAQLTGTLTLNDEGNPNAVFIFQIGSTLTTASASSIVTINGGANPGNNLIWQVGSSATLGTDTAFEGNILANASITLTSGATDLDGRLLAENGAVTLEDNFITMPVPYTGPGGGGQGVREAGSTLLLLGFGLAALIAFGRRFPVPG